MDLNEVIRNIRHDLEHGNTTAPLRDRLHLECLEDLRRKLEAPYSVTEDVTTTPRPET